MSAQHTPGPQIPAGMAEVSKDEFFAALRADKRDIMPRLNNPYSTDWEGVQTRQRWGWSYPGWKNPMAGPKVWAIAKARGEG